MAKAVVPQVSPVHDGISRQYKQATATGSSGKVRPGNERVGVHEPGRLRLLHQHGLRLGTPSFLKTAQIILTVSECLAKCFHARFARRAEKRHVPDIHAQHAELAWPTRQGASNFQVFPFNHCCTRGAMAPHSTLQTQDRAAKPAPTVKECDTLRRVLRRQASAA